MLFHALYKNQCLSFKERKYSYFIRLIKCKLYLNNLQQVIHHGICVLAATCTVLV